VRAGMSRASFAERFAQAHEQTPMEFVQKVRLRIAANLLTTTDLPIKMILNSIGYTSRSSFSRAFRGVYGVYPKVFPADGRRDGTRAPAEGERFRVRRPGRPRRSRLKVFASDILLKREGPARSRALASSVRGTSFGRTYASRSHAAGAPALLRALHLLDDAPLDSSCPGSSRTWWSCWSAAELRPIEPPLVPPPKPAPWPGTWNLDLPARRRRPFGQGPEPRAGQEWRQES
jgi:AraC-like DNA-binding protein